MIQSKATYMIFICNILSKVPFLKIWIRFNFSRLQFCNKMKIFNNEIIIFVIWSEHYFVSTLKSIRIQMIVLNRLARKGKPYWLFEIYEPWDVYFHRVNIGFEHFADKVWCTRVYLFKWTCDKEMEKWKCVKSKLFQRKL